MYLNPDESEYKSVSPLSLASNEIPSSMDFSYFPFYQPESSYISDPLDSPPPEFFDDNPTSYLYSSHLSVIEEDSHSLCISHTYPLQHVLDTLAELNDETTEIERLVFLKKKYFQVSLLNHFSKLFSNPSNRLLNPDYAGIVDSLLNRVSRLHSLIQEVNEHVEYLREAGVGDEEIRNVEEYAQSLGVRLQFLQKLINQAVSEKEPVISLEVIDEAEEICEVCEEKGMEE